MHICVTRPQWVNGLTSAPWFPSSLQKFYFVANFVASCTFLQWYNFYIYMYIYFCKYLKFATLPLFKSSEINIYTIQMLDLSLNSEGLQLIVAYRTVNLSQHRLRQWLVAWGHQAITWTNIDSLSMEFCGAHLITILPKALKIPT